MKSINSIEANNKVRLLYAAIGYRRETAKIEKELKTWVKELMGEESRVQVGEFLVSKKIAHRTDFDREALISYLGEDIKRFEKETVYEVLNLETFRKVKGVL